MSMIFSVYSTRGFKEFLLPSINNADYQLVLQKEYFALQETLIIKLEILKGLWKICQDYTYKVYSGQNEGSSIPVRDNDVLTVDTFYNEKLTIIVTEKSGVLHSFDKYKISDMPEIHIGKDENSDIVYTYLKLVSREHAVIQKVADGYEIVNKSPNGTYVNAVRLEKKRKLKFGDYINIMGLHIVFLGEIIAVDSNGISLKINNSALVPFLPIEDGTVLLRREQSRPYFKEYYHRAPRLRAKLPKAQVEIEAPPDLEVKKPQSLLLSVGPSVTMALPMLLGCLLMVYSSKQQSGGQSFYLYSGLVMSLSSALIGVIWSLVNIRSQKAEEQENKKCRFEAYSRYLVEKTEEIKKEYDYTAKILEEMYPCTEQCLAYDEKSAELWNRNSGHEDFLSYRLGIGDIPFQIEIVTGKQKFQLYKDELAKKPEFIRNNYKTLFQVPVTLDLKQHHLIGAVGGIAKSGAIELARILSAQVAANNCYTDVKLCYAYDRNHIEEQEGFQFARWLPHTWSEDRKTRFISDGKEEASNMFYELTKIFRARSEQETGNNGGIKKPWFIVFIADVEFLNGELFSKYVFEEKAYGLTTVLLAERCVDLPNSCEFIIQNDSEFQGKYDMSAGTEERTSIKFDAVREKQLDTFARGLSGVQVIETEEGGEIPTEITFFDMMGVHRLEELPVAEYWAKNRTYDSIRGMLGQKAGAVPCFLDVHEKYHGPHGLVAGTTGSGKSETLQTYMLSLVVNYSPDDIAFFIIDYKGGGMANLFDGLPHMAGQISNLSGNQVRRAMISIKSENRRRQRLFNENGVNNINAYTRLYKDGNAQLPIPHLFIIIDEFAELKREEPEFMKELISVAQVGRSLGVHMILATQKPNGTVDDNIWSNSKFRLCLRVQDKQDSNDMLHKPDAAYITQAGRGYLQVGNDEIYEQFQSGYSGAVYNEQTEEETKDGARLITLSGKELLSSGKLKVTKRQRNEKAARAEITQLDAVKQYLIKIAEQAGYNHRLQLWMPVLPEQLYLDSFEEFKNSAFCYKPWGEEELFSDLEIILGKLDDPENQSQLPLTINFIQSGHVAVVGGVVCGKSTMLQTMMYGLIQKFTPQQINIYGLDFSNKMMDALEAAPQMGGLMYEGDLECISKFFNMLEKILKERKTLFRGGNYLQYIQKNGWILPAILLFIDNYSAFKEKTNEVYEEFMIQLSKEGVAHGIYIVVSGSGFGMNEITQRVADNIDTVLCLSLQDKYDYADMLHTMQIEVLPERGIKGRGLALVDGRVLEYQTALAVNAENDYDRLEKIRQHCEQLAENWHGKKARRIPQIPEKPIWSEFQQLDEFEKLSRDKNYLPVAYNMADASVYGISLYCTYCYLITGKAHSGKTNYMKICIQSALYRGASVSILGDSSGELAAYKDMQKVHYAVSEDEIFDFFKLLMVDFKTRNEVKNRMLAEAAEEEEIFSRMCEEEPHFIFLPDLASFILLIYQAKADMRGFLENIIAKGRLHNIYFIGELSLENRDKAAGYAAYESFIGYKTGIHFGGQVSENNMMDFEYISFMEQMKSEKPGIGQLPLTLDERNVQKLIIPQARR